MDKADILLFGKSKPFTDEERQSLGIGVQPDMIYGTQTDKEKPAVDLLVQELVNCQHIFAHYADLHSTKGTIDGNAKSAAILLQEMHGKPHDQ